MSAKQRDKKNPKKVIRKTAPSDVPQFFRLNIEVGDLTSAISFYTTLLGVEGRKQAGSRCYFECGPVTLQVLDVSSVRQPHAAAKALYFTVNDLEAAYKRAGTLGCLSREDVHDAPGGGIVVHPWGERSFYAVDPWKNPLCFVEAGTVYAG
jgi:predicted enzyme related to lactoylglutathione lyase